MFKKFLLYEKQIINFLFNVHKKEMMRTWNKKFYNDASIASILSI